MNPLRVYIYIYIQYIFVYIYMCGITSKYVHMYILDIYVWVLLTSSVNENALAVVYTVRQRARM